MVIFYIRKDEMKMKLPSKSTVSIIISAMSLATSTIFAADDREERKDGPEYAAYAVAAAQPSSQNARNSGLQRSQFLQSLEEFSQSLTAEQMAELLANIQRGNFSCSAHLSQLSPEDRELKRLMADSQDTGLFPLIDPFRIKEILNLLVPKYVSILQEGFANRLDFSNENHKDFFRFLMGHDHFITNDLRSDKSLVLVLKMLTQQFDLHPHLSMYLPYGMGIPPYMGYGQSGNDINDNPIFFKFAGIIHGEFVIRMDSWFHNLKNFIQSGYYRYVLPTGISLDSEEIKGRILGEVMEDINNKFSVPGGDNFDIERDARKVSQIVENWFKVVHQLAVFELQQWEHQQVLLDSLQCDYGVVEEQLKEAVAGNLYFSGITKTSHSIGLTEVERAEQASSVEFLQKRVHAYRQADEKKLSEYKIIKGMLPSLKKLISWIDDVFAKVSKKGRMS
jgi:hypothetical protein